MNVIRYRCEHISNIHWIIMIGFNRTSLTEVLSKLYEVWSPMYIFIYTLLSDWMNMNIIKLVITTKSSFYGHT